MYAPIFSGSSFTLNITIYDSATSVAMNLTGGTVVLKLLDPTGLQYTITPTVVSLTGGVISATLTTTQLRNAGTYQYQAQISFSGGEVVSTSVASFVASAPLF